MFRKVFGIKEWWEEYKLLFLWWLLVLFYYVLNIVYYYLRVWGLDIWNFKKLESYRFR